METLNSIIVLLNSWGSAVCEYAGAMFLQSSLLVGLILIADLCLRKRISARFRYGMWLLVLVKLVLPPSLAFPTGAGYWLVRHVPAAPAASAPPVTTTSPALPALADLDLDIASIPDTMAVQSAPAAVHVVRLQWPGLVLLGWAAGILALLALVLWQIALARRSLRQSRPAGGEMAAMLQECCTELGITAAVGLRLTEDLHSPAVCGFLRPVILLPTTMPRGLGPEGLRSILLHELTHIQRRDPWVSLTQICLQVVYFWHPLVWAAGARIRELRELAVDETVVARLRSQAQCYTDTLIDIAQMAFRKPAFSLRLIGIAESKRALERRITHMLNRHTSNRSAPGWCGLLVILALGAVLVPMGPRDMTAHAEQNAAQLVPTLPEGIREMFQLNKQSILEMFGEPDHIFFGDTIYTLDNLPKAYFLAYKDISFAIEDDVVGGITLLSPSYVFGNGIHVGDSEAKVKQAFGPPSEVEEAEAKDFLNYEPLGLSFEIDKQNRSIMEINIGRDYGDPAQLQAYVNAAEFSAALPQKLAAFNIDSADLNQVIAVFGQPVKYIWGSKTLPADNLPGRFIAVYPGNFYVFMLGGQIVEVRHENGSTYVFAGKLRIGSTLEEAIEVLGEPVKTVQGQEIDWQNSKNVLFRDIDGRKGHDYYHRPDRKVRVWFANDKVAAIYMTRSNYGQNDSGPADPAFDSLLAERVARLNIDSADLNQVIAIFGAPTKYIWGDKEFSPEQLPNRFIAVYPSGFRVFMMNNRIVEIRFEKESKYAFAGKLAVGATLEEALAVLGQPVKTVEGKPIDWSDTASVLYKDISGKGHCYYSRPDQAVRLWFSSYRVVAIYMTRSNYSDDSNDDEPADPEFASQLQGRVDALDIDTADLERVLAVFGPPRQYVWGEQTFTPDALPENYIMRYPYSFDIWMQKGRIIEVRHGRHGRGSPYVYRGVLRIGSTEEEAIALLGQPTKTVTSRNEFKDGVLYQGTGDETGAGYYHRSDQRVRLFFAGGKVTAIYMTRSDFPVKN